MTIPDPYRLAAPPFQRVPLVFTSSHSGSHLPAEFLAMAAVPRETLRQAEDRLVDVVFAAAPAHGAPLLAGTISRAFCDANREQWELDPAMFRDPLPGWANTRSPRVRAGIGTVPRLTGDGRPIHAGPLPLAEAERRIAFCWVPFHRALEALVEGTVGRFGGCLLVDCHSMPEPASPARHAPDFVLGDLHGTSCDQAVTEAMERWLRAEGYAVRRNDPYAGGYITRRHGRPAEGRHAVQVEVARRLYLDPRTLEATAGLATLTRAVTRLIGNLAQEAGTLIGLAQAPVAAE